VNRRMIVSCAAALLVAVGLGGCSVMNKVTQQDGAFDLEPGACFSAASLTTTVSDVPTKDCAEAHDAEIIGKLMSTVTGDYDQTAITAAADKQCTQAAVDYVGPKWIDLDLSLGYLFPDQASWGNGKRTVICYARTAGNLPTLTASLKGKGA